MGPFMALEVGALGKAPTAAGVLADERFRAGRQVGLGDVVAQSPMLAESLSAVRALRGCGASMTKRAVESGARTGLTLWVLPW